ncbi:MAG: extracellular solute-binding protein [Methylobacteriaceae bacterium]|nr:extracellular solute-binding protein [Methylobacteriaceae bacterium]
MARAMMMRLAAGAAFGLALVGAQQCRADEITLFHDKPFYQTGWDHLAQAAKAAGIDLKTSAYATDQYQAFIQTGLQSGEAPSLFTWWNGTKLNEIVETGQIAPLDELWQKKIASGEYDPSSADPFKVNGKIYAVPDGLNRWVVLYNKKMFAQVGIEPPTTWDELMADCDKLKKANITPFNATIQEGWRGFIWFEELMIRTNPDAYAQLNAGKLKYTDPAVQKAFKIWGDLYAKGYFTDPASQEEPLDFARGKAAMYLIGDWAINLVAKGGMKPGEDFDAFIMPNVEANLPHTVIVEAAPILVSAAGAKNPDVQKFIEWYMSPEAQNAWAEDPGLFAGNKKAKAPNPIVEHISKLAADGKYQPITRYWEASPSDIVLPAVEELNRFMTNPTPEQANTAMANIEKTAAAYWMKKK